MNTNTTPTVITNDFRLRILAFTDETEARAEMAAWKMDGCRTRIIHRLEVWNVLVTA